MVIIAASNQIVLRFVKITPVKIPFEKVGRHYKQESKVLMTEDLGKLKEIIRKNISSIKEVADALVKVRDKLLATEETVAEVITRVEKLESSSGLKTTDGIRMFGVPSNQATPTSLSAPELDIEAGELTELILQHPTWLRPFSMQAELEKHEHETETIRLRRSSSGYLRVIRLNNGSEWAYFEEISIGRFTRLPLLQEVFEQELGISEWKSAWVSKPLKLQALQRGARWEIVGKGKFMTERA